MNEEKNSPKPPISMIPSYKMKETESVFQTSDIRQHNPLKPKNYVSVQNPSKMKLKPKYSVQNQGLKMANPLKKIVRNSYNTPGKVQNFKSMGRAQPPKSNLGLVNMPNKLENSNPEFPPTYTNRSKEPESNKNLEQETEPFAEPDLSAISVPNQIENGENEQEMNKFTTIYKISKKEFVFKYNSDKNGLFYYLGTKGEKQNYKNPFEIGELKVFVSSLAQGDYSNFVGRSLTNCRSANEENAFFGVDLGKDRSLIPKHYTIRNRDSNQYVLLNWTLEASLDFQKWFMIDRRIHNGDNLENNRSKMKQRELLMEKGAVTTWTVQLDDLRKIIMSITSNYKSFKGFRYFRIRQIGKNSSNSYNLALSGFELYGTAFGVWKFPE
jgi:hypothetical protein